MPETWSQRFQYVYAHYFGYWVWLLVTLILGSGVLLVVYPVWKHIQSTGALEYTQLVAEKSAKQTELDQLKIMSDQLAKVNQSQLLHLQDVLPTDITPAELMEQVVNSFSAQGLQVESIDVVDEQAAAEKATSSTTTATTPVAAIPGVKTLKLTVNVTGDSSYDGLKKFLHVVASSNPIFDLYSITYAPERKSFSLVLTTYVNQ